MFLMIENEGVAPVESYTKLGVSTARGSDKIGQFGTGNKHAILVCLRKGINPFIYCGRDKLEFSTAPKIMGTKVYDEVQYSCNNKKMQDLNWSTDFGSIDWSEDMSMALREFVSNALDQTENINMELVEKPRAKSGYTRVFIPMDSNVKDEIKEYISNIQEHFLQFNKNINAEQNFIPNRETSPSLYRRGVLVCSMQTIEKGLFHYNLNFAIDECRNLDEWRAKSVIGKQLVKDKSACMTFIDAVVNGERCWETEHLVSTFLETNKEVAVWWKEKYGDLVIASNSTVAQHASAKGLKCITTKGFFRWLQKCGVTSIDEVLNHVEKDGNVIEDAPEGLLENVQLIWSELVNLGFTNKPMPNVKSFYKPMNGGKVVNGYYILGGDTIYIHRNSHYAGQVILEELSHYITQASDASREFQDFAFAIAAKKMGL